MNKPLIAITPSYDGSLVRGKVKVSGEYLNALWQAGAMPVPVTWLDPKTPEGAKKLAERMSFKKALHIHRDLRRLPVQRRRRC